MFGSGTTEPSPAHTPAGGEGVREWELGRGRERFFLFLCCLFLFVSLFDFRFFFPSMESLPDLAVWIDSEWILLVSHGRTSTQAEMPTSRPCVSASE